MAFDKAVDSTALNAGLTKIADAIRAKGGTEGAMVFPDGFAEMIGAIQAGGGGNPFGTNVTCGVYIPASDQSLSGSSTITITHDLGVTPKSFVFFSLEKTSVYLEIACASAIATDTRILANTYGGLNKAVDNTQSCGITVTSYNANTISFWVDQSAKVVTGKKYGWVAIGG